MKKPDFIISLVFVAEMLLSGCSPGTDEKIAVLHSPHASAVENLAAKELKRYLYLRTGNLPLMGTMDSIPAGIRNIIIVCSKDHCSEVKGISIKEMEGTMNGLRKDQYLLQSVKNKNVRYSFIIGGDVIGTLYGAYRFAEILGVRFYLHGDVVPDKKLRFEMPELNEIARPLFELRGIHPFHDFPEGPDWWNVDEYKAILAQLPKMGMNFFGLHTYPEGGPNAEPTVWIGQKSDIGENGKVKYSYSSSYQSTHRGNWGFKPENTGDYNFGASLLFESEKYGAGVMDGMIPSPGNEPDCNELFNRTGEMFRDAFTFGRKLGVKICIGTETPLIIPRAVKEKLLKERKNPADPKVIGELYEGIFERIRQAYPIDYYWLWTPEGWTWDKVSDTVVRRTENDLLLAVSAANKVNAPFTLATCGWVLGPPKDRGQFDKSLPKNMPFSCINRYVGFSQVEPAFAGITNRPKWAIPWLEDDPGLIYPQLWAGRMRRDAMDAMKYGCTGLFGIHWRTQVIGPNVSALAKAAWDQGEWRKLNLPDTVRDIPVNDFYTDWALAQFGPEVFHAMGEIFTRLDGGPLFRPETKKDYEAFLYRPVTWIDGPGGIKLNKIPRKEIEKKYAFLAEFEALGKKIKGHGYLERYGYWLHYFQYARNVAQMGCVLGELDSTVHQSQRIMNPDEKKKFITDKAIPLRLQAAKLWSELETNLLSALNTTGEMGTIANIEQHNMNQLRLLNKYDSILVAISGRILPDESHPTMQYLGPERIFITANRSLLEKGEDLHLKVIILSNDTAIKTSLHWRSLGTGSFMEVPIRHLNRAVYQVKLDARLFDNLQDIEYYITASMPSGKKLIFPATAPDLNQTVLTLSE